MKRIISILLSMAMTISLIAIPASATGTKDVWDGTVATSFAGGTGTQSDPYKIATGAQLAYLAESMWDAYSEGTASQILATAESHTEGAPRYNAYTGKYFELVADIDLNDKEWTPIGNGQLRFNGKFDGNGHTVSNLKITKQWSGIGLFGATGYDVHIEKLGVTDVDIRYANATGSGNITEDERLAGNVGYWDRTLGAAAFVGIIGGGTIENCFVKNASIVNTATGAKEQSSGGFIGIGASIEKHSGSANPYNKTYVTNCYIKDLTCTGHVDAYRGAFCGNVYVNDSNTAEQRCEVAFTRCYAGGTITMTEGSTTNAFARCGARTTTYRSGLTPATKLYTSVSSIAGNKDKSINSTYVADAVAMATALVDSDNYVADSENKNGGWPVLAWEISAPVATPTPTVAPTATPTVAPTATPTVKPTATPTMIPTPAPTLTTEFNPDTEWAGNGTMADPYQITTADELAGITKSMWDAYSEGIASQILTPAESHTEAAPKYNAYTDKYFKLMSDIDLNNKEWAPIGNGQLRFNGNFNGNGHVVSNVKITKQWSGIGFFGATGYAAHIENLGLKNVNISYTNGTGGSNITEDERLAGVGYSDRTLGAAAFVGIIGGGTIENCYVKTASVINTATAAKEQSSGGFIGIGYSAEKYSGTANPYNKTYVTNCYIKDLTCTGHTDAFRGAFCGNVFPNDNSNTEQRCEISFTRCYAGGTITMTEGSATHAFARCGARTSAYQSGLVPATKLYTSVSTIDGSKDRSIVSVYEEDAEAMKAVLVDSDNYFNDLTVPVNGGWPVLAWETGAEMWDGTVATSFSGGTGTKEDPYLISTAAQLAYLAKSMWDAYPNGTASGILAKTESSTDASPRYNAYTGKYFKLTADINLKNREWTPIGNGQLRFNGNFNGDGHIISNVKITKQWSGIGLFGATGYASRIENLGVKNVDIRYANGTGSGNTTEGESLAGAEYSDRTLGAGAFIGLMGGGTVENCYVKTASVVNTATGAKEQSSGGFIGAGYSEENYSGSKNPYNKTYITNCYITDVTCTGHADAYRGAFIGDIACGGTSTSERRLEAAFKNCYVGGSVAMTDGSVTCNFGRDNAGASYASGLKKIENCYTMCPAMTGDSNWRRLGVTYADTVSTLVSGIVDHSSFHPDNEIVPINNGLPVLAWEARYWINDEESDILTKYFLNKITKGQSKDYIFNDIDLLTAFTHNGRQYKVEWNTSNNAIISNSGKVTHSSEYEQVEAKAYVYDVAADKFATETITFNVTPRGAEIFISTFDGDDFANWATLGTEFANRASISDIAEDKLLQITATDDDNASELTRMFTEFTNGVINTVFSVYNDAEFTGVGVKVGDAEVRITPTSVTVGGTEISFANPLPENEWITVAITSDIDNDTIFAAVNGETAEGSAEINSISGVTILETGNALIDKVLVYESMPAELDELSYDTILDGQSRYHVNEKLNLPEVINFHRGTINVKWESSDTSAVKADGDVLSVEETGKVTLTAKAYDENPDDVLEVKTFEIYVTPKGSTLLHAEDFESASSDGQKIETYKGWSRSDTADFTRWTITKDPKSGAASFETANKAMRVDRYVDYVIYEAAPPGETTLTNLDNASPDGIIEINFDMYLTSNSSLPLMRIEGQRGNTHTEFYITKSNGFFSNTTVVDSINGNRQTWSTLKENKWIPFKIVMNNIDKTIELWVDGVKCKQISRYAASADTVYAISFGSQRHEDPAGCPWYIDNLIVRNLMPQTDSEATELVASKLEIPSTVSEDLGLPSMGEYATGIWWTSSDESVIGINGKVNQGTEEKAVTLTATIFKGLMTYTRDFEVTVPAAEVIAPTQEIVNGIAKTFPFSAISDESQFYVTENLDLISDYSEGDAGRIGGVSITWSGFNDAISEDGTVTQGETDKNVVLTATLEAGDFSAVKKFKVSVPQSELRNIVVEDFEDYGDIGSDINDISANWSKTAIEKPFVNGKIMRDIDDSENTVLAIKRKAFQNAKDEPITYNGSLESTDMLLSTSFMLNSKYDIIRLKVLGINQQIVISRSKIKVGDCETVQTLNVGEWYKLTVYYDGLNGVFDVYLDDVKKTQAPVNLDATFKIDGIEVIDSAADKTGCTWYIDNIVLRDISLTDEEAIAAALNEINLSTDVIEWNIDYLPTVGKYGTKIEWVSSKPDILTNDGVVYRKVGEEYQITFTVTASRNGVSRSKVFNLTIPALTSDYVPPQDVFEKQMDEVPFSYFSDENPQRITEKINFKTEYFEGNSIFYGGANISWSSNKPNVIDNDGNITRQVFDTAVKLTATYTSKRDSSVKYNKVYNVTVWAEGEVLETQDFEYAPAEWEKKIVDEVNSEKFKVEDVPESTKGQNVYFSKDPLDANKAWAEANKTVAVDRYKAPTGSPQRCYYYFDTGVKEPNSVAISFDFMMDAEDSVAAITLDDERFLIPITPSTLRGKSMSTMQARTWYTFTVVYMQATNSIDILRNGEKFFTGYFDYTHKVDLSSIRIDVDRQSQVSKFYIDNLIIRRLKSDDETAVNGVASGLSYGETVLMDNLNLQFKGDRRTLISYKSSNPDVLTDDGVVIRPYGEDATVDLTAYISRGGAVAEKKFTFTVKAADGSAEYTVGELTSSDKVFSSVSVTKNGTYSGTAKLIVAAYDQNKLIYTRCIDITSLASGTAECSFTPIDLTNNEYYRVVAYVMDENSVISNKQVASY